MQLVCISDTHGDHERLELPEGDVLVHAGDVTAHGTGKETQSFMAWLGSQNYAYKVCIAGNHDRFMEREPAQSAVYAEESGVVLLNDSGCVLDNVTFWGSPITPRFFNWSFMRDPGEPIEAHWNLIPKSTDVLITHGPPQGILDEVYRSDGKMENTGCPSLLTRVRDLRPSLHLFGHIHEGYGSLQREGVSFHNISTMDERYRISNLPRVIAVPENETGGV